jgi:hypothetical protein
MAPSERFPGDFAAIDPKRYRRTVYFAAAPKPSARLDLLGKVDRFAENGAENQPSFTILLSRQNPPTNRQSS